MRTVLVAATMLLASASVTAQQPPQARPAQQPQVAVPDQLSLAKLVLSTMTAIDHANKTGNYSVLLDLGSNGFRSSNSAASLSVIFDPIRQARIDLSGVLMMSPTYEFTPAIVGPGTLRVRGSFPLRPQTIGFDFLYQWDNGWRLDGVALAPLR